MPRVPVDRLRPGWHLASTVYNHNGLVLLSAGTKLTTSYIRRMIDLGVRAVDVQLAQFASLRPREVLSPQLRSQATATLRKVLADARKQGQPSTEAILPYVDRIVDQVLRNQEVMVGLTDIRAHDAYTHAHSVNVCMLATMIGRSLGYTRNSLLILGIGAIMHDLGKVYIDPEILTQRSPLTWDQYQQVQEHPVLGYQALDRTPGIPRPAAMISLQHHERLDASGYPHAAEAAQIGAFSRIVAVADVYDAISSDRPYRAALTPLECLRLLSQEERGRLWPDAVNALAARIAPYPEGSTVELEGGELAVVIRCTAHSPLRPEVAIFTDNEGNLLAEPVAKRLSDAEHEQLTIRELLTLEGVSDTAAGAAPDPDRPSEAANLGEAAAAVRPVILPEEQRQAANLSSMFDPAEDGR